MSLGSSLAGGLSQGGGGPVEQDVRNGSEYGATSFAYSATLHAQPGNPFGMETAQAIPLGPINGSSSEDQSAIMPTDRELRFLLFAGIPPISFITACDSRFFKPLGLTLYRGAMTIIILLGVPTTMLTLHNDSNVAAAIIGMSCLVGTVVLFWAKEYRDKNPNWAPWLFEKDHTRLLIIIWCIAQLVICRIPSLLAMSEIRYLWDDVDSSYQGLQYAENLVFLLVDFVFFTSTYATVYLLSNFSHRLTRIKDFLIRLLLEEVIIFLPRISLLTILIGCVTIVNVSMEISLKQLARDVGLAIKHATGFGIGLALLVGLRKLVGRRSA